MRVVSGFTWQGYDQKLICVFAELICIGSSFLSLGAVTKKVLLPTTVEHAAGVDHWNEVAVFFTVAESCFEYILVVHCAEPGRSGNTI